MTTERLRPDEKPKDVTQEEWESSACELSPTGSHHFKLTGSPGDGPCKYCGQLYSKVHPRRK